VTAAERVAASAPAAAALALVVDDDVALRLLMRETLEQCGLRVEEADNGASGLETFQRVKPDIVLLDVMMPVMDGFETCARLRRLPGALNTPVLMMTGLDDSASIDRAYECGATDFITKPVNWPILGHRLRYMLRAAQLIEDLAKSEASLANAQQLARLASWTWDGQTRRIRWSESVQAMFGLRARRFAGTLRALLTWVHPDDRRTLREALHAALRRLRPFELDFRIVTAAGELRNVHAQAQAAFDAAGRPTEMHGTLQDITERKRAEEQIRVLANYDSLTGLPNRRMFQQQLDQAIAEARRERSMLATLFIDLDRFKRVNDTLGHGAGDTLLVAVSQRLQHCLRGGDYVGLGRIEARASSIARLGGDEFVVVLTGLAEPADATRIAQRIRESLAAPVRLDEQEVFVTASIGVSIYPRDGEDAETLLKRADSAMYCAKEDGRNNCHTYSCALPAPGAGALQLEADLRRALERDEFTLVYQPQVDVADNRIVGVEALMRWRHPERGLIAPAEFIPLAEQNGLIEPIGGWVLEQACRQNRAWQRAGYAPVRVSVNISGRQLQQGGLAAAVAHALATSGLEPQYLALEFTETVLLREIDSTIGTMAGLKQIGVALSLDDFGTGYSSLTYLKRFPIDELKIDRSFIRDVAAKTEEAAITRAIIGMAQGLKLDIIAEGVETEAQAEFLRTHGCSLMQGFLFWRPMSAPEIGGLLQSRPQACWPRPLSIAVH